MVESTEIKIGPYFKEVLPPFFVFGIFIIKRSYNEKFNTN